MKKLLPLHTAAIALTIGLLGCKTESASRHASSSKSTMPVAIAALSPTTGHQARGMVTFTPTANGVRVHAEIMGLTPGKHGFHVHEKGDCSAPDASSAGGHFNPTGMPHGGMDAMQRHVGDFGNIVADDSGNAHADFVDSHISLEGPQSIIGRAIIIHAQADDLTSQPSGNAGARAACGVIERQ